MSILNQRIRVLDYGFVELVDYMGSDRDIEVAARVSHDSKMSTDDEGTRRFIRFLMRNGHLSPFEMCELKFHVKVPIFVWRQWIRHRTASVCEKSMRYTKFDGDYYNFDPSNKDIANFSEEGIKLYNSLIDSGVPREEARIILPLNVYTEAFWKIDLRNLLHFLKLRLADDAQVEIREYAYIIACIVNELFPITFEAWLDYSLNSVTFSRTELKKRNIERDISYFGLEGL